MANYTGQQIGRYRINQRLGSGGFAEVYLATHVYLNNQVAIKLLHVPMGVRELEEFCREAQIVVKLKHPHIVNILDFAIEDQTPFLVMEYASRGSLRARHPRGTQLPLEQVVAYTRQIAGALQYAHKQRVIHRDIKPENILLNDEDNLVLSDFGLAIIIQSAASLSTQNGAGTPYYIAPEQIRGKPCAASDQYALGIMVYEWLCGEVPFRGAIAATICNQHLDNAPPGLCERVPTLPTAVEAAVLKALSKEPRDRFPSVQEFAFALEQAALLPESLPIAKNDSLFVGNATQSRSEPARPDQHAQAPIAIKFLPNVDEIDNKVMKLLCDEALVGDHYWVGVASLVERAEALGIPSTEFFDSLRILDRRHYIEMKEAMGGYIGLVKISVLGFEGYARAYIAKYKELREAVIAQLADENMRTNTLLATQLHQPIMIINQILKRLAEENLIDLVETMGTRDNFQVFDVSPELRRKWKKSPAL